MIDRLQIGFVHLRHPLADDEGAKQLDEQLFAGQQITVGRIVRKSDGRRLVLLSVHSGVSGVSGACEAIGEAPPSCV
ncbi:hypothetical protein [Cohnella sp. 56]|uniref:hypothetical protein n=1 Tax=Cohnella sp. 56 TaxID=3113722 RepID=UPI0030E9E6E1